MTSLGQWRRFERTSANSAFTQTRHGDYLLSANKDEATPI